MTTNEMALYRGPEQITDEYWKQRRVADEPTGLSISERAYHQMHFRARQIEVMEVGTEPSEWFGRIAAKLWGFMEYSDNWDSYGAKRPDKKAIDRALNIMLDLSEYDVPEPSVGPTSQGGIQIEWHTKGFDLELEILASLQLGASFKDQMTGEEWDQDICNDMKLLIKAFKILSERH